MGTRKGLVIGAIFALSLWPLSHAAADSRQSRLGQGVSTPVMVLPPPSKPVQIAQGQQTTPVQSNAKAAPGQLVLSADQVTYDPNRNIITAEGNVEVFDNGKTLLADRIIYNEPTGMITAEGNVALKEADGDVWFASRLEVQDDLKEAIVRDLKLLMADHARVAAAGGRIRPGGISVFNKAVYSACEPCKKDPTRAPLWQVKAVRVVYDAEAHRLTYKDTWLEFFGVPILYLPYFSHPDATVNKATGLLSPSIGHNGTLGGYVEIPVFINLAPWSDLTLTPIVTQKQRVALAGEFRHHFTSGIMKVEASATVADREDVENGNTITKDDVFRGHIDAEGLFEINNHWRWGFDLERATDKTYLRAYDFSNKRTLTSQIFAERFAGRSYFRADAAAYQGLRNIDENEEMPIIMPELRYSWLAEPDNYGGYLSLDADMLVLSRLEGHDTRRFSLEGGYTLPYISRGGSVWELNLDLRGDLYWVNDFDPDNNIVNSSSQTLDGVEGRIFPQASLAWRYPLVSHHGGGYQQILEPIASLVVAPDAGNPDRIPNEDSQDILLDETNFLSSDRLPGFDRVDGGQRINYGLRWALLDNEGREISALIGQSYQFSRNNFPDNSGFEHDLTDIVGRVQISPHRYFDLMYRFQLDDQGLDPVRHELSLKAGPPALRLNLGYHLFEDVDGTLEQFSDREQIRGELTSQLTQNWRISAFGGRDLALDYTQYYGGSFRYEDECFVFGIRLSREFFEDEETDPDTNVKLTLSLRNLGDFANSIGLAN